MSPDVANLKAQPGIVLKLVNKVTNFQSKLSKISRRNRILVWALLISLSITLLSFPVHLINVYHSIEAPYIFNNLPLFGGIFCCWMLVLLFLALSGKEQTNQFSLEKVALAADFGLVFLGFWIVITPLGGYVDAIYNMGIVHSLVETGTMLTDNPNFHYLDFPGMHLLVAALSQVGALDIFKSSIVFLLINTVLFSALIYTVFYQMLKNNILAFLSVLIIVMGNVSLVEKMVIFTPGCFGFTLLAGVLFMLNRPDKTVLGVSLPDMLLMLVFFVSLVVSYFAGSFLAALIIFSILVVQTVSRGKVAKLTVIMMALFILMVLIWEVFWASNTFNNLTGSFSKLTQNWLSGDFLTTFFKLGAANLGGSVPFWATLTHLFWWGLIIISTLLGLFLMRGLRKMDIFEKLAISGLLGVIILSILSLFGTTRGSQFYRFLLYAPLFCAPILLGFLFKSKIWGRLITIGLVIVMFVGSLPTFLSSVNTISTDAIRAYDINGGAFLADNGYGNGDNLTFFRVSPSTAGWVYYYLPDVNKHTIEERAFFDQTLFWEKLNLLVSQYNKAEGNCVFVVDTHTYVNTEHLLGIHPEDSGWQSLNSAFNQTDMIYTNGNVQIYSRQ